MQREPEGGLTRREGVSYVDGVALTEVATRFGTPTYVYSAAAIRSALAALRGGLGALPHRICYAVKANANLAVLDLLAVEGCDFDTVSKGELARLLALGIPADRVILSGVGKRDGEIAAALAAGVLYIAVESESELEAVSRLAAAAGRRAKVSLRVNPDVDARTHPYIATGLAENKFGVPMSAVRQALDRLRRLPALELVGLSCHIGSQITALDPFRDAAVRMSALANELRAAGVSLRYLGMGGGLGIRYTDEDPPSAAAYGRMLQDVFASSGLELVLEPGRALVGDAGVLLTRVVRRKRTPERDFVIVDASMNDLVRPALYGAHHAIAPVEQRTAAHETVDVVGPVCESSDTFARGRDLPRVEEGDLLVFSGAGAYGFTMSSTYNGRPQPAEVLVRGGEALLVRERGRIEDLWRGERRLDGSAVPPVLPGPLQRLLEE